jgi:hypothetical protein
MPRPTGSKLCALDLNGIASNYVDYDVEVNNATTAAIKNGHVAVVRWMLGRFEQLESDWRRSQPWHVLGDCAGGSGDLVMAEWLVERFQLSDANCDIGQLLIGACEKGNMQFILWLTTKFHVETDDALCSNSMCETPLNAAVGNGHLDVANWLVRTFGLTAEAARVFRNSALQSATGNGHLDAVKWLFETLGLTEADAREIIDRPSEVWNAGVVAWLRERFPQ